MNLVVDCCFIMSSILPDETQPQVEKVMKRILEGQYKAYVPALFYLECSNVLISALRRNRINKEAYEEYIRILRVLPFYVDKFCSTIDSMLSINGIAIKHELTSYDAAYIELAMRLDCAIATLDKQIATTANGLRLKLAI